MERVPVQEGGGGEETAAKILSSISARDLNYEKIQMKRQISHVLVVP